VRVSEAEVFMWVRLRSSINLKEALFQVDNPVIGDAGTGVQASLAVAIVSQRCFAHLNDKQSSFGIVSLLVVEHSSLDNRDIGIGNREWRQVEGHLHAHPIAHS